MTLESVSNLFEQFVQASADFVCICDRDGRIRHANPVFESITGYSANELEGTEFIDAIHPAERARLQPIIEAFRDKVTGDTHRSRCLRKDSEVRWISWWAALLEEADFVVIAGHDITEQTLAEQRLVDTEVRIRALHEVSVSGESDFNVQIDSMLRLACEILGQEIAIVSRIEGDDYTVEHCFDVGDSVRRGQHFTLGGTYCALAIEEEDILAINHMGTSRFKERSCYKAMGLESYIGVPVYVNDALYGSLCFSSQSPRDRAFGEVDREFVGLLGTWVSSLLLRSKTEEQLQLAQFVLDNSGDAILWIAKDGRFSDANESAQQWLGYSAKEMAILTYPDVDPGVTPATWPSQWNAVKSKGSSTFETELQTDDGGRIPVEITMNYVDFRGRELICAFARDIRDRRRAEARAQESAARVQAILETAAMGIVTSDDQGTIQSFNAAAEAMFGYSSSEIVGKNIRALMPHADIGGTSVGRVGHSRSLEAKNCDGAVFPVEVTLSEVESDGQKLYTSFINDISVRKKAEENLHDLNRLLSILNTAQAQFIQEVDRQNIFQGLLDAVLELTDSEYGFVGEILQGEEAPYLKTYAITNIAWNEDTRKHYEKYAAEGLEFFNLESLFGRVITSKEPVISNDPYNDDRRGGLPEGHPALNAFLGMPIMRGEEILGMVGIANRPGGYDDSLVQQLNPFLTTSANIIAGYRDRQRREDAEAALYKLARNDALTDLPNRRVFLEEIEKEMARAQRHSTPLSIVMLDLDRFKGINDTYGHAVGDRVLVITAEVMRSVARQSDTPARLGGEEFAFVLSQTTENSAMVLAERLRAQIEATEIRTDEDEVVPVTTSVGVATYDGEEGLDRLIQRADEALYRAKDTGRNRVVAWSPQQSAE